MNLDFECAEASEAIKRSILQIGANDQKDAEGSITKALGVLQEDGIYAFYLYLASKKKQGVYCVLERETKKLLKNPFPDLDTNRSGCQFARDIISDLDRLLLAKEILERVLIYARYHAKAMDTGTAGGQDEKVKG